MDCSAHEGIPPMSPLQGGHTHSSAAKKNGCWWLTAEFPLGTALYQWDLPDPESRLLQGEDLWPVTGSWRRTKVWSPRLNMGQHWGSPKLQSFLSHQLGSRSHRNTGQCLPQPSPFFPITLWISLLNTTGANFLHENLSQSLLPSTQSKIAMFTHIIMWPKQDFTGTDNRSFLPWVHLLNKVLHSLKYTCPLKIWGGGG